jgi:hypothetical protein
MGGAAAVKISFANEGYMNVLQMKGLRAMWVVRGLRGL